jgi:hypothetical protein
MVIDIVDMVFGGKIGGHQKKLHPQRKKIRRRKIENKCTKVMVVLHMIRTDKVAGGSNGITLYMNRITWP